MKRRESGMTLIELMIALALSALVIDGAVALLLANRTTSQATTGVSATADVGRVAITYISQAVRSAGYFDCGGPNESKGGLATYSVVNLAPAGGTPIQNNYQFALGGFEAAGTAPGATFALPAAVVNNANPVTGDGNAADWTGGLDGLVLGTTAAPGGASSPGAVKGSDVLIVRESLPQFTPVYTSAASVPGGVSVPLYSTAGLQAGTIAALSNCGMTTVAQLTGVGGGTITVNAGMNEQFDAGTPVTPLDMYAFFVGPGRDGDSALWVYDELRAVFYEIAPDVENLQVLYGLATTSPDQATQYVTADNVPNFNQVVSVRISLLVASPVGTQAVAPPAAPGLSNYTLADTTIRAPNADGRLRKVFDTTIGVRSAVL